MHAALYRRVPSYSYIFFAPGIPSKFGTLSEFLVVLLGGPVRLDVWLQRRSHDESDDDRHAGGHQDAVLPVQRPAQEDERVVPM